RRRKRGRGIGAQPCPWPPKMVREKAAKWEASPGRDVRAILTAKLEPALSRGREFPVEDGLTCWTDTHCGLGKKAARRQYRQRFCNSCQRKGRHDPRLAGDQHPIG